MRSKLKLVLERKPPPPPIVCALCDVAQDEWKFSTTPDRKAPICRDCLWSMDGTRRRYEPSLSWADNNWLTCAQDLARQIDKESRVAR